MLTSPNPCLQGMGQRASFFLSSAFLAQGSLARAADSLARNSESPSCCKGPWITGVEERSRIPSTEKPVAPQHQPGQEGEMLESIAEGLGVRVPADPRAELPAPHGHLTGHPTRNSFTYNITSESHFWWQLSRVQPIPHQFCCPGLAQSPRQTAYWSHR